MMNSLSRFATILAYLALILVLFETSVVTCQDFAEDPPELDEVIELLAVRDAKIVELVKGMMELVQKQIEDQSEIFGLKEKKSKWQDEKIKLLEENKRLMNENKRLMNNQPTLGQAVTNEAAKIFAKYATNRVAAYAYSFESMFDADDSTAWDFSGTKDD